MIRGLNDVVVAKEQEEVELKKFDVLPKGWYKVMLTKVDEWKPFTYEVLEIKEKGVVVDTVEDCTIYNADIVLEIIEPAEYKGRKIFTRLTTHPNMPWVMEGFLHAMEKAELAPKDIATLMYSDCMAYVTVKTGKAKTNPETGQEYTPVFNEVSRYKRLEVLADIESDMDNI